MYTYQYITLCDDFVILMLEYILPRASVLFYLHVLLLSVYAYGYFRPAYVRRSNVSVPSGSGRYNFAMLIRKVGKMFYKKGRQSNFQSGKPQGRFEKKREELGPCFHCKKNGHLIADCPAL